MIFSNNWHDIGSQKVWLRPQIDVRRQVFRGEVWYVLADPLTNEHLRLRPEAWELVGRLDSSLTVDEVWRKRLDEFPENTPTQTELIELLANLHRRGLLLSDRPLEAETMDLQKREEKSRRFRAQVMNFLFVRIPLFNPDRWLRSMKFVGDLFFSRIGIALYLIVVGLGLFTAISNADSLVDKSEGILAPGNLFTLYLVWAFVKLFHELGHAFACRRFGGEVPTLGIMLLVFTPIPYCDASSSWRMRESWKRLLVSSAGMIVELFLASLALLVWAKTGRDSGVSQVAYNVIFLASVSTLLFNINPLLRFDGYYILCDLLGIANLHQKAQQQLRYVLERYCFGLKKSVPAARNKRGAIAYVSFGVASSVYRVFVFAMILLFLADRFLGIGLVFSLFGLVSFIFMPIAKFIRYLLKEPRLEAVRTRACIQCSVTFSCLFLFLSLFPWPQHFRAPALVQCARVSELSANVDGSLVEIRVPSGERVEAGEVIAVLENPELELLLKNVRSQEAEISARLRFARSSAPELLSPLQETLLTLRKRRAKLEQQLAHLIIYAPHAGIWSAPYLSHSYEAMVPQGQALGQLIDDEKLRVFAAVKQTRADHLYGDNVKGIELRFPGQLKEIISIDTWTVSPVERRRLPSASLGWSGGGMLATDPRDETGEKTIEPYFEVSMDLPESIAIKLAHEQSAYARIELEDLPLFFQAWQSFRQLLQHRYRL